MQTLRIWDRVCIRLTPQGIWDPGYEIDHSGYNARQEHDVDDDIEQDGKFDESADARDDKGSGHLYFRS